LQGRTYNIGTIV